MARLKGNSRYGLSTETGTKSNPVYIRVPADFFVQCPKCQDYINTNDTEEEIECSNCGKRFWVTFDLFQAI